VRELLGLSPWWINPFVTAGVVIVWALAYRMVRLRNPDESIRSIHLSLAPLTAITAVALAPQLFHFVTCPMCGWILSGPVLILGVMALFFSGAVDDLRKTTRAKTEEGFDGKDNDGDDDTSPTSSLSRRKISAAQITAILILAGITLAFATWLIHKNYSTPMSMGPPWESGSFGVIPYADITRTSEPTEEQREKILVAAETIFNGTHVSYRDIHPNFQDQSPMELLGVKPAYADIAPLITVWNDTVYATYILVEGKEALIIEMGPDGQTGWSTWH